MSRDFEGEARREIERNGAALQWIKDRVVVLHDRVSTYDVLTRYGIKLRAGGNRDEQFSCPFHGKDNKPSARFYPSSNNSPSHVWCYVCQERWDCITLWKKFAGFEGKFGGLLREIEMAYGITPPEAPSIAREEVVDEMAEEVQRLFTAADHRLRNARRSFKKLDDMYGFLTLGSVLDRLRHEVIAGSLPLVRAKEVLRRVLDKIGEKERACPVD